VLVAPRNIIPALDPLSRRSIHDEYSEQTDKGDNGKKLQKFSSGRVRFLSWEYSPSFEFLH